MKLLRQERFFWIRGVVVFIITMALMFTLGYWVQSNFGLYGVFYTQLLFIVISIAGIFILRLKVKDVLPVKVPRMSQIFGVIIMVISALIPVAALAMINQLVFPEAIETADFMGELFRSTPVWIGFLIVSVAPAICEEILHRGVIQHTFERSGFRSKWVTLLSIGLIFGLFHIDYTRYAVTALLGIVMAYIMIETKNILLPMLYHFLHNAISFSAGVVEDADILGETTPQVMPSNEAMLTGLGFLLILSAGALFAIRLGARLIGARLSDLDEEERQRRMKERRKMRIITVIASSVLFVMGVILIAVYVGQAEMFQELVQELMN
ncbi:MAG: CPBP family intramembrane metalloprotease [Lachnospiraceae bacterium]|jgi:membrane protease YdiL (CAAX protease family)|nr:CPBP family intramembrane metalloprotease [Lachnospiraceae bacterium]